MSSSNTDVSSIANDVRQLHLDEQPISSDVPDPLIDVGPIPPSLQSVHTIFGYYISEAAVFHITKHRSRCPVLFERLSVFLRGLHSISGNYHIQYELGHVTEEMKEKFPWIDEEVGSGCWLIGLTDKRWPQLRPRQSEIEKIRPFFRHDACWWPASL